MVRRAPRPVRRAGRRRFPDIVSSVGPFGPRLDDEALLPASVPILAVMGDSHAALFGHGGWRDGLVKATYGTGSSVMAVSA